MLGRRLAEHLGPALQNWDQSRRQREQDKIAAAERERNAQRQTEQDEIQRMALMSALSQQGIVPEKEREGMSVTLPGFGKDGLGRTANIETPDPSRYQQVGTVGGQNYYRDKAQQLAAQRAAERRARLEERKMAVEEAKVGRGDPSRRQIVDGQIVDLDAARATPIEGYRAPPPKPAKEPDTFGNSMQIQTRFDQNPDVKAAREMSGQVGMLNELKNGSPMGAGDIAIIIGFNKVLDPGAIVREGDVALAQSAASLKGRVETFIANAKAGQKMDPQLRADMLDVANRLAEIRMAKAIAVRENMRALAAKHGADPELATMGGEFLDPAPPPPSPGPAAPVVNPQGPKPGTMDPAYWLNRRRGGTP